jgi:peptide/nickel transport system permease protein
MRFLRRRLIQLAFVLFFVTLFSFLMLHALPGDTAQVVCGISCNEKGLEQTREELGLNKPIAVQYVNWLGNVARGDLGSSALFHTPVATSLKQRLPVTLELLLYSEILALLLAVPAALLAAQRAGGLFDRSSTTLAFGLLSVPDFVMGVLLILIFSVNLGWFPVTKDVAFFSDPIANLHDMFLPALTLAVGEMAVYLRLLRTDLIATLQEDYVTMARAKGISSRRILLRHAFRPSSFSLVTVIGLDMGRLIGGAFIVETLFALNGIGSFIVQSIESRDYIAVQGGVLLVAIGYVLINFAVDLLYSAIDPRIRHARALA